MGKKRVSKELVKKMATEAIEIHDMIIKASGGELGVRDKGGIEFAMFKILNYKSKYQNNPIKVTAYIFRHFARRHYFFDGNKRFAHIFAKFTLLLQKLYLKHHYKNASKQIIKIAKGNMTLKEIETWLKKNIYRIDKKDIEKYLKDLIEDITYGRKKENE